MPDFQKPKAKKAAEEAQELFNKAAKVSGSEKAQLETQANAKLHEADKIENGH